MAVSLIFFYDRCKIHTDAAFVQQGYSLGFMSEGRFLWDVLLPSTLSPPSRYILPLFVHVQA